MLNSLQDAILHLFAILAAQGDKNITPYARNFVITTLSDVLSQHHLDNVMDIYDNYVALYAGKTGKKGLSAKSVKFLKKAETISSKLSQEERNLLCIRTMEFVTQYAAHDNRNLDFVKLIANVFLIDESSFENMLDVISGKIGHSKTEQTKKLPDALSVLFINQHEIYVKLNKKHSTFARHDNLYSRLQYQQNIKLPGNKSLLYSDILKIYMPGKLHSFKLHIQNLYYTINKQLYFHGLSLSLESPGLCAIVGPSGSGKSTFLKLIAGILHPDNGFIGFTPSPPAISFVPQEDSINPDLSARDQLLTQAKKHRIPSPCAASDDILQKTGLSHKSNSIPGTVTNSMLSGGERKRLSIGCGIITNPDILICDEPSSGLSFDDTNTLIRMLRNIANENCLVICSLHQPADAAMAFFDNMLYIDEQGYPVYFGSPDYFLDSIESVLDETAESLTSDKNTSYLAGAETRIHKRKLDEFGRPTLNRKHSPSFWNKHFNVHHKNQLVPSNTTSKTKILHPRLSTTLTSEMVAFFNRKAYASMLLLYAPFMAFVIGSLCRFSGTEHYTPLNNPHFPVFFIMTVVVALFSGLIFSLGELCRKQPEHKRNWVTEKSNSKVFFSKLCILFPAGIIQAIFFSFIALYFLDILYLFWSVTMVYFLLFIFATATGLILSALSNGKNWTFLVVPLLLIPQILFSGAMIPWDKFPLQTETNKAPVISRFFAAAWAYEGLTTDALLLYPETDYHHEKAYFISTCFLQDALPVWYSYCNHSHKPDLQPIKTIQPALPQEIHQQIKHQQETNLQAYYHKLKNVFESTLSKRKHIANIKFPLLWHQIQHTELPPVEITDNALKINLYPLYFPGSFSSYKSAKIKISNQTIRHAYVSWAIIFLMGLVQYILLFFNFIHWPWKITR